MKKFYGPEEQKQLLISSRDNYEIIANPNRNILIWILERNPNLACYLEEMDEELQMIAVKADPAIAPKIKNLCRKAANYVVLKRPHLINSLKNVTIDDDIYYKIYNMDLDFNWIPVVKVSKEALLLTGMYLISKYHNPTVREELSIIYRNRYHPQYISEPDSLAAKLLLKIYRGCLENTKNFLEFLEDNSEQIRIILKYLPVLLMAWKIPPWHPVYPEITFMKPEETLNFPDIYFEFA